MVKVEDWSNYELAECLEEYKYQGRLPKNIKSSFLEVIRILELDFSFNELSQIEFFGQHLISKAQDIRSKLEKTPELLYECVDSDGDYWINIFDFREVGGRGGAINLIKEINFGKTNCKHCATCTCKND